MFLFVFAQVLYVSGYIEQLGQSPSPSPSPSPSSASFAIAKGAIRPTTVFFCLRPPLRDSPFPLLPRRRFHSPPLPFSVVAANSMPASSAPSPEKMLEVHRYTHVEWRPSPVVALAASVDGKVVASARGNGSIEIWAVSSGSVGWHCELTIPGKRDASLSCLMWSPSSTCTWGRLFSAGLDGFISEWNLSTLLPKEVMNSYGGSIWKMVIEPEITVTVGETNRVGSPEETSSLSSDNDSNIDKNDGENSENEEEYVGEKRVAIACDDGSVRLFTVKDGESLTYKKSFPRIEGRILSVAWSVDAKRIFSGGSDGCIRCWDARVCRELFRITAGLGGAGSNSNLCIWSLLSLKDGTVVSGDSSGSTQFWDGNLGTFLQAFTDHKADVLALAASPSNRSVFAAGADGQVVQYQHVHGSKILADAMKGSDVDVAIGLGERWVYVGYKRTHSHDVNALVVASPRISGSETHLDQKVNAMPIKPESRGKKKIKSWMNSSQFKLDRMAIPMLISAGNDAKLFTYPANVFIAFQPHDVCHAPQRTPISLAVKQHDGHIMIAQHEHEVEVWRIIVNRPNSTNAEQNKSSWSNCNGKRKSQELPHHNGRQKIANGHSKDISRGPGNGHSINKSTNSGYSKCFGKEKGSSPELLARIKCKSAENITCSALSGCGKLVAFSDNSRSRVFELEQQNTGPPETKMWGVTKRMLPANIPPAQCMVFCGFSQLILACSDQAIWVIDIHNCIVQHRFVIERDKRCTTISPITSMCTSQDGRWLATSSAHGDITVFDLELFQQHWQVPPLDGGTITASAFRPGGSGILVVTTNANILHELDVEEKRMGEWSRKHGSRLPQSFLEFPGGIQGLSFCPSGETTTLIAYSSKAMSFINFTAPVPQDEVSLINGRESAVSNGLMQSSEHQNGTSKGHHKNFVMVPFKDPVLFVGHVSKNSIVVVEKPWLEAVKQLPPPVYRHRYGT